VRDNSKTYTITSPSSSIALAPTVATKSWIEKCEFESAVNVEVSNRPQAHGAYLDPGYLGQGVWDAEIRMYGDNLELQNSKVALFSVLTEMFGEDGTGTVSWTDDSFYATTIVADSPVAYWRLDESSVTTGTVLADDIGAYPGTYTEATAIVPSASLLEGDSGGYSQAFPGDAGSYASIAYNAALNSAVFSWECLFTPNDLSGVNQSALLNTMNAGQTSGMAVFYDAGTNTLAGHIIYAGGGFQFNEVQTDSGFLVEDQTYHVVVVYDATTLYLYIDGILIDSIATAYVPATAQAFTISEGTIWDPGQHNIDEVSVYNTALTASQVREHYAAVFTTKQLVGYISQLSGPKENNGTWLTHVQLITERPFAENATAIVYDSAALDTGGGGFVIPFTIPFTFTGSSGGTLTITNTGDFYMFPVLRF